MIIPQMQQRYTGYSSEGANNLLSAVMGARRSSVMERQQTVNEEIEARNKADYERRIAAGKQRGAYSQAEEKAMDKQVKIKQDKNQAQAYNAPSRTYNALQWINDYINPFAPNADSRARQESDYYNRTKDNPMPVKSDYLKEEYYQNQPPLTTGELNTYYPSPQSMLMNLNLNK